MKKIRSSYLFTGVFLIVLVLCAFMLPVLTLSIQDRQSMNEARYIFRTGLDYTIAYPEYEINLNNRLKSFASGLGSGKEYYAVSSDYTGEEDEDELLNEVLSIMEVVGIGMSDFSLRTTNAQDYRQYQILNQEYYIIYDDDFTNGVAFICRYFQLRIEENYNVTLLVDGKDNTIYYVEVSGMNIKGLKQYDRDSYFGFYYIYQNFPEYYQADGWTESYLTDAVEDQKNVIIEEPYDRNMMQSVLYYDDVELTLIRTIEYQEDIFSIGIGIKEIKELILSK